MLFLARVIIQWVTGGLVGGGSRSKGCWATGSGKRFGKKVGDGASLRDCWGVATADGELSGGKRYGEVTQIGGENQVTIVVD